MPCWAFRTRLYINCIDLTKGEFMDQLDKNLAKTRGISGNDDFVDSFNERLKNSAEVVDALNRVEKLILGFDMSVIYTLNSDASYILANQILYSYRLLLKEVEKTMRCTFEASGLTIDSYLVEKREALNDLLKGYLLMLDVR